jgi:glycosyltransferase involved in cell wall biosynthesis
MTINGIADVTVIIPTMAEEKRHDSLLRAIASVFDATSKLPHVVVVVNGNRRSSGVESSLRNIDHIELLSLETGSLPLAILAGRRAVKTKYFCFLDDDDEYLPGAIDARIGAFADNEDIDFVVTNGYRNLSGVDSLCFDGLGKAAAAPLTQLFHQNWLASCGSLFRSDRIGIDYFEEPHPYVEWTWLAFKLCMAGKKIAVLDQPTFRIHDTLDSVSKSMDYSEAFGKLYRKMLDQNPPKTVASIIRRRMGEDFHCQADLFRQRGKLAAAWRAHLRSLFYPGGWRYLSFSRHLVSSNKEKQAGRSFDQ